MIRLRLRVTLEVGRPDPAPPVDPRTLAAPVDSLDALVEGTDPRAPRLGFAPHLDVESRSPEWQAAAAIYDDDPGARP